MEPSKEAIAVRLTRLNRQILGKVTSGNTTNFSKRTIDREALLDALTVLYDECNDDPVKKCDELVRAFVDKCKFSFMFVPWSLSFEQELCSLQVGVQLLTYQHLLKGQLLCSYYY